MAGERVMIPDDLPQDMPSFMARFGTDQQCREYLFTARWPEGFRCLACGHDDAYALKTKLVYECVACGKQHSLLAGTIFEQTKTGLSRWFLAIYLVTSSKRGISAMELKRQMGFASYGTAWTWLHKIRKAMLRPDRKLLAGRVEADETLIGGPRPGKPGRGAAGKTLVAGAVETGRGKAQGRRLAGSGSPGCPMPVPRASKASSAPTSPSPLSSPPTAGPATAASPTPATATSRSISAPLAAMPPSGCPPSISCSASPNAGSWAPTMGRSAPSICQPISMSTSSASTAAPPGASATASPASSSRRCRPGPAPTAPSS
jgi:hypothetical protein